MFQTVDALGATVLLDNGDKITLVDGRTTELYITDFEPIGTGMTHRARVLMPVTIEVNKFLSLDVNGVPQYNAPLIVKGQSEPQGVSRWDKNVGALVKLADEAISFTNTHMSQSFGVFKALLKSQFDGFMFASAYIVQLINTAYTGQDLNAGEPGTPTDTPTVINPLLVELTTQY